MGEPSTYTFDLREVGEMLVRKQGLKKGKWLVGFEFQMAGGMMGPTHRDALPGCMLLIAKLNISDQPPGSPESPLVIDAATLDGPNV